MTEEGVEDTTMPDAISCLQDKSQAIPTFDCQPVEISGTTTPQTNQSAVIEETTPDPTVQSLVKAATASAALPPRSLSPVAVPPASVPALDVAKAILHCPSPLADVAITALAIESAGVVGAFIGGLKIGIDLANCVDPQVAPLKDQLTKQAAEDVCRAEGGEPRAWNGNRLTCAVPKAETP